MYVIIDLLVVDDKNKLVRFLFPTTTLGYEARNYLSGAPYSVSYNG